MSYFDSAVLLDEASRTTLHDHVHETGSTDVLLHKGGWQVSVSPTLVESDSMNRVLSEDQKAITIPRCGFSAVGKNGSC